MYAEQRQAVPVFKALVKPILMVGIERPLFFTILAVCTIDLLFQMSTSTVVYSLSAAVVLLTIARFISARDPQTFEVLLDWFQCPDVYHAQSGWNAPSAKHPSPR
jgi:type IV secretory pathway VirB3-like protein